MLTLSYSSAATACFGGRFVNRIIVFAASLPMILSVAPFAAEAATAGWPDAIDLLTQERLTGADLRLPAQIEWRQKRDYTR